MKDRFICAWLVYSYISFFLLFTRHSSGTPHFKHPWLRLKERGCFFTRRLINWFSENIYFVFGNQHLGIYQVKNFIVSQFDVCCWIIQGSLQVLCQRVMLERGILWFLSWLEWPTKQCNAIFVYSHVLHLFIFLSYDKSSSFVFFLYEITDLHILSEREMFLW